MDVRVHKKQDLNTQFPIVDFLSFLWFTSKLASDVMQSGGNLEMKSKVQELLRRAINKYEKKSTFLLIMRDVAPEYQILK